MNSFLWRGFTVICCVSGHRTLFIASLVQRAQLAHFTVEVYRIMSQIEVYTSLSKDRAQRTLPLQHSYTETAYALWVFGGVAFRTTWQWRSLIGWGSLVSLVRMRSAVKQQHSYDLLCLRYVSLTITSASHLALWVIPISKFLSQYSSAFESNNSACHSFVPATRQLYIFHYVNQPVACLSLSSSWFIARTEKRIFIPNHNVMKEILRLYNPSSSPYQ